MHALDIELASTRPHHDIVGPYPLVAIDGLLPARVHQALTESFPDPTGDWTRKQVPGDVKWDLASGDPAFEDILSRAPAWRDFVAAMTRFEYLSDLTALVYETLRRNAREGGIPNPRIAKAVSDSASAEALISLALEHGSVGVNLIVMSRGDLNSPHSDGARKLFSLLAYFPAPEWRPEFGGGTAFYQLRRDRMPPAWFAATRNRVADGDLTAFEADTELLHHSAYKANTAVLFGKTRDSFHAVAPLSCPAGLYRRAFQLSVKL